VNKFGLPGTEIPLQRLCGGTRLGEWLSFCWVYLWTLREYWWALVPDLALGSVDLVAKWRSKDIHIKRKWYVRLFVCGLIFAQLLAYKDLKRTTDGMSGQILNVGNSLWPVPGGDAKVILSMIEVSVTNTGNPSAVIGWGLQVTVDGKVYPSETSVFNPEYISPSGFSVNKAEWHQSLLKSRVTRLLSRRSRLWLRATTKMAGYCSLFLVCHSTSSGVPRLKCFSEMSTNTSIQLRKQFTAN
jgi:hypothetical protein